MTLPLFLSLGAGVQSSALLLLYYHGILKPMPEMAIFADTKSEPLGVYENLKALKILVSDKIPVEVVSAGSLESDCLNPKTDICKAGYKFAQVPFHSSNPETGKKGIGRRHCTYNYKIEVITKVMRAWKKEHGMGLRGRVQLAIGISLDEPMRMKINKLKWIQNCYPLVDYQMTRYDCSLYLRDQQLTPVRSACVFCPFRSDAEWLGMKKNDPLTWAAAVGFDSSLRNVATYDRPYFLHSSLRPLAEVALKHENQIDLFTNECEGMCGL